MPWNVLPTLKGSARESMDQSPQATSTSILFHSKHFTQPEER